MTLTSDAYHHDHPGDAQHYFGFPSWDEVKIYIRCMWPGMELNISSSQNSVRTNFEQCLVAKMFLKSALDQIDLCRIWGVSQPYMSKILKKWCHRWGDKARLHVRLQSLPIEFLRSSMPAGFNERYHTLPSTEVDGKDLRCEQIRKDNLGKRLLHSNKYNMSSLR